MTPRLCALAVAISAAFASAAMAQSAPAASSLSVLHCPALLDVVAGKLLGASTVVIDGQRIREVVPGTVDRPGASVINLPAGHTCLPGLIDSHVHLTFQFSPSTYSDKFRLNPTDNAIRSTVYAKATLMAGFTTVRNLADDNNESIALRNAINAGIVPGPRMFVVGRPIGSTGGHADPTDGYRADLAGDPGPDIGVINSPEDAWKAVRQHYKDGADLIKITCPRAVSSTKAPASTTPR